MSVHKVTRFNQIVSAFLVVGDIAILNSLFGFSGCLLENYMDCSLFTHDIRLSMVLITLCYLVCSAAFGVVLADRVIRPDQIVRHIVKVLVAHCLLFVFALQVWDNHQYNLSGFFLLCYYPLATLLLIGFRLVFRSIIKAYRKSGRNTRCVVFVGCASNMEELYHQMTDDPTSGYRVLGYFDNEPAEGGACGVPYLGGVSDIVPYLQKHGAHYLYCCLPSKRSDEIMPIVNYCENHFVRFYSVPNVRRYLKRRMVMELMGDVPVLSIRREPLSQIENRLLKRSFDVLFSLAVLCTVFPVIYIFVALVTKITSPGPVFFKQKRSGENGKVFTCYKFRSMKVNGEADKLQATKDDPRKTRFGDFLRKSNIDEIPQFINVLMGDMSVVGPRPHMLKHTEEYSALIDKFMVRHWVKPGITGWAQVTGFRGETKLVAQMEGRVRKDIWYIENWTFLLDLFIIYKTLHNAICGDKKAY